MTWRDCSNVFLVASLLVIWHGYNLNITHRRKSEPTDQSMSQSVTVNVSDGTLRGRKANSKAGIPYYSFQGIPYARPPVGSLRFKMIEPVEPWSGVRDALKEGSSCTQFNLFIDEYEGTEDCLYVNVYSPQLSGAPLKPVMVCIHGGGYVSGSGNSDQYGPDYLVDEGVVLVTFNYRLGVLGFLCVDDPAAPGNLGLKDQVAALRWVQKNISAFGGDPNNVTIFGISAGGGSVHYHMLSPMSKGLFHRAIAQSGTAFSPWGLEHHPREMAFRLGAALGCTTENPQQLVEFLRDVDHMKLITTAIEHAGSERDKQRILGFPFVPSLEMEVEGVDRFLPANPLELLEEGRYHAVPYMTGVTSHEGIIMLKFADLKDPITAQRIDRDFEKVTLPAIRIPEDYHKKEQVCSKLRHFFLQDQPLSEATLPGFLDMIGDLHFAEGIHITVKKMAQLARAPVYYYRFSHEGQLNFFKLTGGLDFPGACHADDFGYLFRTERVDPDLDPESPDVRTRSRMVKMWTNFAKTGNPTPEVNSLLPVTWPQHTAANPCYLDIGQELSVGRNLHRERMAFWEELYRTLKVTLWRLDGIAEDVLERSVINLADTTDTDDNSVGGNSDMEEIKYLEIS